MSEKITIKKNQKTEESFFEEGCYITEFWNENFDADVSIARARVKSGETTKKHLLTATTERYLILEGEGTIYLDSQPGRPVRKNDVVLIPAATSQFIENTGKQDLVFLAICSPRFVKENYRELE